MHGIVTIAIGESTNDWIEQAFENFGAALACQEEVLILRKGQTNAACLLSFSNLKIF